MPLFEGVPFAVFVSTNGVTKRMRCERVFVETWTYCARGSTSETSYHFVPLPVCVLVVS